MRQKWHPSAKCRLPVVQQRRGSVGAYRIEPGMTNRKLSGGSVNEIQADCENNVDADEDDDLIVVRADVSLEYGLKQCQDGQCHHPEDNLLHTFSVGPLPMMPSGFTSRIRTRMMNAMASRYVDCP